MVGFTDISASCEGLTDIIPEIDGTTLIVPVFCIAAGIYPPETAGVTTDQVAVIGSGVTFWPPPAPAVIVGVIIAQVASIELGVALC
jgi:hypothetical protein